MTRSLLDLRNVITLQAKLSIASQPICQYAVGKSHWKVKTFPPTNYRLG